MSYADDDNPYLREPPTEFESAESLTPEAAERQADQLRAAIRDHDHHYYVDNDPVIADRVYDRLFDRLRTLEAEFELDEPDSPTTRVGGEPVDELDTVEHTAPMLSIAQSGEAGDVREFDKRTARLLRDEGFDPDDIGYVCEPKFDGISIELVYEDGRLTRAATRGDGAEGDDVTDRRVQRQRHGRSGNPARVVADSTARTPLDARILDDEATTYLLVSEQAPEERRTELTDAGAELIVAGDDRVDLAAGVDRLADEGLERLMIEGGGELIFSAVDAGLVDELSVFVGSQLIGGRDAPTLADGDGFTEEFPALTLDDIERLDDGVVLKYTVEG